MFIWLRIFVQNNGQMKLRKKTVNRLKKQHGNWALVTGATSGIGKELAIQLASAGFNIVIAGRREAILRKLSTKIFDEFGTETIPIAGDLSQHESIEHLLTETAHLPIGLIVLNAGFGTSGKFIDSDINTELNLVDLNCKTLMKMTHHFANKMINESREGSIVLLSSMVAFQGVPNAANYSASKAYVQSFGEALQRELKSHNINVLCVAPGPVNTGFSERANMRMNMALSPKDIAVPIIKSMGKRKTIFPGALTKFLVFNLRLVPRSVKVSIMGKVMAGFTQHQH